MHCSLLHSRDVHLKCFSLAFSTQLALAYIQASLGGKLTNARGSVVQSIFIGSLRKRLEDLFQCSQHLSDDFYSYLKLGRWPADGSDGKRRSIILSWYLQWFGVPSPSVVEKAMKKVNAKSVSSSSLVPLLRLLLPSTHISALSEIGRLLCSSWQAIEAFLIKLKEFSSWVASLPFCGLAHRCSILQSSSYSGKQMAVFVICAFLESRIREAAKEAPVFPMPWSLAGNPCRSCCTTLALFIATRCLYSNVREDLAVLFRFLMHNLFYPQRCTCNWTDFGQARSWIHGQKRVPYALT